MYKLILGICIAAAACGPSKQTEATTPPVVETINEQPLMKDSAVAGIPPCLQKKIDSFNLVQKHEQPQKVIQYQYKGKTVYYVLSHCCDFFNELYDSNCNLMGYPDGGFTGKGDGKFPDFAKEVSKEKLIWEAK
jgi:hypothetical protein